MQQTEPLLVTRRGDRNMKLCKPRIALVRDALQRTGARPRGLTTCAADSYRTETKVSCVAIASSRVACARKLRCTCNCEAQRTRHPEPAHRSSPSSTMPRLAVPHRVQRDDVDRRRNRRIDHAHQAMPSHRTGVAHAAPTACRIGQYAARDRQTQSSLMPSAANCNLGSDRVHQSGGFKICHPTSRRRGRVEGPS